METLGRERRRGRELATTLHKVNDRGQVSSLTGVPQRTDCTRHLPLPLLYYTTNENISLSLISQCKRSTTNYGKY